MKKLLALLLCFVMIFSLAACTGEGGSGKEDEAEELEYPLSFELELDGMSTVITIEEKDDVTVQIEWNRMTTEDLEDMDIEVDDAEVVFYQTAAGTYKEKKGTYTLTLDRLTMSMKVTGKDAKEAKQELEKFFEDEFDDEELQMYNDMLSGKDVDITEEYGWDTVKMELELDGSKIDSLTYFDHYDTNEISEVYTFHSNGKVKTETMYQDGEPYMKITYDKNGEITNEMYYDSNTPAASAPPYDTVPPYGTEPDDPYWDYEYYDNGVTKSETHYYDNGNPMWIITYYPDGTHHTTINYYENGNTESREVLSEYGNTLEYIYYYEDGTVQEETYCEEGIPTVYNAYYPNGNVKYHDTYYSNGNTEYHARYYENGNLSTEYGYFENGQIQYNMEYREDGTNAYSFFYNENGTSAGEVYYYENGLTESVYEYDEQGQLFSCGHYYENGELHYMEQYKNGEMYYAIYYHEDGTVDYEYSSEPEPTVP